MRGGGTIGPAADSLRVLLIVDPTRDLPGAAAEGDALKQLLGRKSVTLDVLAGRDATRARILAALGTGAFDVLHFAGHAFFDAREPDKGGLLCDGKEVLRGGDLAAIGNLPALVFCNACEAARVRKRTRVRSAPARLFGLRRTMTGIAEAFLAGGVANFLGTHWPVGDDAAFAFSQSLYESMLTGERLGRCGAHRTPAPRVDPHGRLGRLRSLRQPGVPARRLSVNQRTFILQAIRGVPASGRKT